MTAWAATADQAVSRRPVAAARPAFAREADAGILAGRIKGGLDARAGDEAPPAAVIACKAIMVAHLSSAAKAAAAAILEHLNWTNGRCDPGLHRIADVAGYSRSNVHAGITQLAEAGLLSVASYGSRSSHRNAYAFNWDELGRLYQVMALKLRPGPSRKQDGAQSRSQDSDLPEIRTQTLTTNPEIEPLVRNSSSRAAQTQGNNRQAEKNEQRQRQLFLTHVVPGGKADATTGRQQAAANAAAEARWDRDLRQRLSLEAYGSAVEAITPALQQAATEAELRKRGSGFDLLVSELSRPTPVVLPPPAILPGADPVPRKAGTLAKGDLASPLARQQAAANAAAEAEPKGELGSPLAQSPNRRSPPREPSLPSTPPAIIVPGRMISTGADPGGHRTQTLAVYASRNSGRGVGRRVRSAGIGW